MYTAVIIIWLVLAAGIIYLGGLRKSVKQVVFGGTRFLLTGYPTAQSRVMFHREIRERVKTLAPFLQFDDGPYILLANGKLYWIIDAYTTSTYYPYSEVFSSNEMIQYQAPRRQLPFSTQKPMVFTASTTSGI
jgi:uncharacterized membrane protein (UPF0182 family)